ncbi:MAG TPA: NAD-dependent protein deacylase [Candidatus Copromorpha excrementigallinarum]|uniref:NAD-dependent protein deacetylase n=1 Tax=Candidatus Allocopromorpha excrementigallinarum TaxID=2840742 RepID=A0A9D1L6P1_9FIRM|nr:NAD-dependent protein deacylase [Candidatus Copromorpha excrementigallinarum]
MDKRVREIVDRSKKLVFFGGAGVSTESDIPDFRSETGLYKAMNDYGYPPEYIISKPFFERHTEVFFDYYKKNLVYPDARPNKAHKALAALEKEGKLAGIITQNIDGLHQKAGSKRVVELHGSILRNRCTGCGMRYGLDYIMNEKNCVKGVPRCENCGGTLKPEVVLYEEALDEKVLRQAVDLIKEADALIVGGTSLVVYPAAGLIDYFRGNDLVLINKSETPYDSRATLVINDAIGRVLGD